MTLFSKKKIKDHHDINFEIMKIIYGVSTINKKGIPQTIAALLVIREQDQARYHQCNTP